MGYLAAKLAEDQPTVAQREELIAAMRIAILARSFPSKIYIFGSVLGEDFTNASDIDVAVVFDSVEFLADARKKLFSPPVLIPMSYDLLLYVSEDFESKAAIGGVCQVIKETARLVYDKRSEV